MILDKKQLKTLDSFKLYRSPVHEESLFKGIDIQYLKLFKKEFRGKFRYRPRGGKYYIQNNCTMKDAKTFAVYKRDMLNPARHRGRWWVA